MVTSLDVVPGGGRVRSTGGALEGGRGCREEGGMLRG